MKREIQEKAKSHLKEIKTAYDNYTNTREPVIKLSRKNILAFEIQRFIHFCTTTLKKEYKYDIPVISLAQSIDVNTCLEHLKERPSLPSPLLIKQDDKIYLYSKDLEEKEDSKNPMLLNTKPFEGIEFPKEITALNNLSSITIIPKEKVRESVYKVITTSWGHFIFGNKLYEDLEELLSKCLWVFDKGKESHTKIISAIDRFVNLVYEKDYYCGWSQKLFEKELNKKGTTSKKRKREEEDNEDDLPSTKRQKTSDDNNDNHDHDNNNHNFTP